MCSTTLVIKLRLSILRNTRHRKNRTKQLSLKQISILHFTFQSRKNNVHTCTDHNFSRERRAEAESNRSHPAYLCNALIAARPNRLLRPAEKGERPFCFTSTEASWLIRDGDRGEGDERVKARPRIPPEKDRRDRGPPPEQWKC